MKFGHLLQSQLVPDWQFHYMDYDRLKHMLKENLQKKGDLNEYDESLFVDALEHELEKVKKFRDLKGEELSRKIEYYERHSVEDPDRKRRILDEISTELSWMGNFARLNYAGFLKILKKHDKHSSIPLKGTYFVKFTSDPIPLATMDRLILRLSKLYRANGETTPRLLKEATAQEFTRRTTKYWVHPDNVTDVKVRILKHLPVLVYDEDKKGNFDQAISSVYYDSPEGLPLYHGRLGKAEGAKAIRFRWYKGTKPYTVYVEQKVHREDWTGELSVKSRFSLKEKYIDDYISGVLDLEAMAAREEAEDPETMVSLMKDIQGTIREMQLKPVLRTFYHRMAFQMPNDATVRISLDTELAMILEHKGAHWRREDVEGEDYPFPQLASNEIVRFPYAILEVKLKTQLGEQMPAWVDKLVNSHLVRRL